MNLFTKYSSSKPSPSMVCGRTEIACDSIHTQHGALWFAASRLHVQRRNSSPHYRAHTVCHFIHMRAKGRSLYQLLADVLAASCFVQSMQSCAEQRLRRGEGHEVLQDAPQANMLRARGHPGTYTEQHTLQTSWAKQREKELRKTANGS